VVLFQPQQHLEPAKSMPMIATSLCDSTDQTIAP
jgi:hypothetical protein